jgi:hypothetical protein
MGKAIDRGYRTSMRDIPQPVSIITGANLNLRPRRPEDEDLASLLGEVLTKQAEKQGKPAPSAAESQELLGLLSGLPTEVVPPQTPQVVPAPDDKTPPPLQQGRTAGGE